MSRFDYFKGATYDWQGRARFRLRQVLMEHPDDALTYIENRMRRAHWASYERRRWSFIRGVYLRGSQATLRQMSPI